MKRIISLLLCLIMVAGIFASCGTKEIDKEKGSTIPVYLSAEISSFDPVYVNLDDASMQIQSLLYEGLYRYASDGKAEPAQAESVKVLDDAKENYYAIEITLKKTCWSNGSEIQANDYIDAWTRILDPSFRGEGANLLFAIKNARLANEGDVSIDDVGITAVENNVIRIEFEGPTDYNKFYEYLASPMLVPIRRSAMDKVDSDWTSNPQILVTNGPFCVRKYEAGKTLVLERNAYYCRDNQKDAVRKYVTPYRLTIDLKSAESGNLESFVAGKIVFNSNLPLAKRAEYASSASVKDTMSVLTYVFNTDKAPFNNPDVRRALSMAIDRNKIVSILTFAKAAGGIIPSGVFNTGYSKKADSFRDAGGSLISASADLAAAKKLLQTAGVNGGDITITVRKNEADIAVAEYVKTVWDSLGFNVTVDPLTYKKHQANDYDLVADKYLEAYDARDFQVISIDFSMFTTDALPNLAMFAKAFAGGKMNMEVASDNYELAPHVSGYYNAEYDALIEKAFAEKDASKRAEYLHQAEKMLMNDMPVMPLVQLQSASISSGDIEEITTSYFGLNIFTKANLINIAKYPGNEGYVEVKEEEEK